MLLTLVAGTGIVVGGLVVLLSRKWPKIEAPRLAGETIVHQVRERPRLARHLRHHFNPRTEAGVALTIATVVVSAATIGIGVTLAMIRNHFGAAALDLRLARYAARHATRASTDVLKAISELGGTRGVILIACLAAGFELIRRPGRALVPFLGLVVGGQFALSNGIKYVVERARPDISRLTGFAGASFPSGHSTAASATLAAVALVMTRGRSRSVKMWAAGVAAGVAAMVGMTRVLLGVHWFTDVVAGLLLGWGWFALCSIVFGARLLTFGLPVEAAERVADTLASEPDSTRSST